MKLWLAAGIILALRPATLAGQSLAAAAREENERRDELHRESAPPPTITGRELAAARGRLANEPAHQRHDVAEQAADETTPIPSLMEEPTEPDPELSESEARQRLEIEWRRWAAAARARVEHARRRRDYLRSLFVLQQPYELDESGRRVIMSVRELQRRAGQAESNLEQAEQTLADMIAKARRAGIPPGWLR